MYIFFILICVGTFLLLSLSLSLSLSQLVCSMAPKKSKSTPSRNPFRSGASTSDSTSSHIRFRDEKARQDFLKNLSRRDIHSKRQVILSDFSDTILPTIIYNRSWKSLCGIPVTCPSVIIQEFYSNMHGFDYSVPYFITHVRGTHIVVTLDLIFEVIHVLRVEFADHPNCDCLRIVSKDELMSLSRETPSSWGDRQNNPYLGFAKIQDS